MIVMPANNSNAHVLEMVFPGKMGVLFSPSGKRDPRNLPWGLDNEMYSAWVKSGFSKHKDQQRKHWNSAAFLTTLSWASEQVTKPRWVVVPDIPGNAGETLREFDVWADVVSESGFTLAIAAQDGMTPADIPDGVVCFLGGSTDWKWSNVEKFCKECPRVHVGRVNQYARLWQCEEYGAESVDGSGFFRGDQAQQRGLIRYLKESTGMADRTKQESFRFTSCR